MFVLWLSLCCIKRALEEKKLARDVARNSERLAMYNFHEKTALVEVFSKVCDHSMVLPPFQNMVFLEFLS